MRPFCTTCNDLGWLPSTLVAESAPLNRRIVCPKCKGVYKKAKLAPNPLITFPNVVPMNTTSEVFQVSKKVVEDLGIELQSHPENFKWTESDIIFERANPPVPGKMYSAMFGEWNVLITVAFTEPVNCEGSLTRQDGLITVVHIPTDVSQTAYSRSILKQFPSSS